MLLRRTLAQLMAAATLLPAGLSGPGPPPADAHRLRLVRRAGRFAAHLGRRSRLQARAFIFAGDNVYGDFNTADAAPLRKAYATADAIAGYNKLRDSGAAISRSGTTTTMA